MKGNVGFISLLVFWGMMGIGIQLVRLPLQIHDALGYDLATVGWVMGTQFIATLLLRPWVGRVTDRLGGKRTVALGFMALGGTGLLYAGALLPVNGAIALGLIVAGRALTGAGEGLLITGGGAWAVHAVGAEKAGQAMSWIGLAMFGGMATGAAAGTLLSNQQMPLMLLAITLSAMFMLRPSVGLTRPAHHAPMPLRDALRYIARPGSVLAFSSVGFSVVSSFVVLIFEMQSWQNGGLAIALFGVGHVSSRLLLGSRADKLTGKGWIITMLLAEGCGLLLIALAPVAVLALAGAMLVGLGFSMIYPLAIMPVLKQVPESSRGIAIALYDAFFDVGMGGAALFGGLLAGQLGISALFMTAAAIVLLGIIGAHRPKSSRRIQDDDNVPVPVE